MGGNETDCAANQSGQSRDHGRCVWSDVALVRGGLRAAAASAACASGEYGESFTSRMGTPDAHVSCESPAG